MSIINNGSGRQFQKVANFQDQWQSIFDNNIVFNALTFNMEQTNSCHSKFKRKCNSDSSGNPLNLNTPRVETSASNISPANYFRILKGFKPVAPKPSTSESTPKITDIHSSQLGRSFKLFHVQSPKPFLSTGKILLPRSSCSHVSQKTTAPQKSGNGIPAKKMMKSKRLKLQEKQALASKNIDFTNHLPVLSNMQHHKHMAIDKIIPEKPNDVVVSERRYDNIQRNKKIRLEEPPVSVFDHTASSMHDRATSQEDEIIIKIETSAEFEDSGSMDEIDISDVLTSLRTNNQLLTTNVDKNNFKNDYCLKVTCKLLSKYPDLMLNCTNYNNNGLLIIYPKTPLMVDKNDSPFVDYLRLLLKSDETYRFQVLHKDIQTGRFDHKAIKAVLEMMTSKSYGLCKGLENLTEEYNAIMTDVIKQSIRTWVCIERIDTKGCLLWYHASQRSTISSEFTNVCRKCKEVINALTSRKKRQIEQR